MFITKDRKYSVMLGSRLACSKDLLVSGDGDIVTMGGFYTIIESEYPGLEGTRKDHRIQLLISHRTTQKSDCLRVLSKCFLNSCSWVP